MPHQNFPGGSFTLPSRKTDGVRPPLHLQKGITNYTGCVFGGVRVEKSALLSFQILQESARIRIALSVEGEKKKKYPLFAAVWQMQEGKGHAGQHCNPPLGLHQREYCFRRSFERNNLFQHFIWLQVPLELA